MSKENAGNGCTGQEGAQSIDIAMDNDSSNLPIVGILNLYYSDMSGKDRLSMKVPDFSFHYELTRDQIDNGFGESFIFFKRRSGLCTSLHRHRSKVGWTWRLCFFYNDRSLENIEIDAEKIDNVAIEEAITLVVDRKVKEVVKDYAGNEYKTIVICYQEWFSENLKVAHYNNGDPIATELDKMNCPIRNWEHTLFIQIKIVK